MATLCLNMIVKNETAILERCLASVVGSIAYYVIADTGSTDGTPELIRAFFAARGIAGEVHTIRFKDFEQARNRALFLCRRSKAKFDYILLTDADMELVVEDPEFAADLVDEAYSVKQVAGVSYDNLRLVRRDSRAVYVGATHEYLDVRGTIGRLDGIWFRDHACGANRVDKYERDARLLVASHRRDPTNTRTMFYLGQTYKDLARHDDAIRWYQKRVDAGDWEEERWYARYMIALCHLRRGDEAAFVHAALAAYEARPSRAEPLYLLAQAYRKKGEHASALIMADAAARIPYPSADRLFVEDFVYRTGIDEELSIAAFYATDPGVKRRGYEACMRLVADPRTPEEARATALANAVFYARSAADCLRALVVELAEKDAALPPTLTVEIEGGAVSIEPLGPALHRALRLGPDGARLRASDPFVFVGSSGERVTAVARVPGTKRLVVTLRSREAAGESARSYAVSFDESSILAWIEGSADPPIQGCAEPARAPSKDANPMRGAR